MEDKQISDPEKQQLGVMRLNDQKAGMQGLDVTKINQIIDEASKGSKFYQHKMKSQERINAKIAELKAAEAKLTPDQRKSALLKMDQMAQTLELGRNLTRTVVHVDMDAFYAAVEMRDNPDLRNKPMAVGSNAMLSTSNYAARKYGVRAAMPGFIARKLCPELVIVPTNMTKYAAVSARVQTVFADYDPDYCQVSLDEAYLDLTACLRARQQVDPNVTAAEIVEEMRRRIKEETQLTASAGIAANTLLAKVCSDRNKPDGQFVLPNELSAVQEFVRDLPIRKVSGIGNVTEQLLGSLGITTCRHLWEKRDMLYLLFSESSYEHFLHISMGLGSDLSSRSERERKSCSCETTFRPTGDTAELMAVVEQLSADLAQDLASHQLVGKAVTLKYKTAAFDVRTRVTQLTSPTADVDIISRAAKKILAAEIQAQDGLVLRLLGVRMSHFGDGPSSAAGTKKQLTLDCLVKNVATPAAKKARTEFTCPVCHSWTTSDGEVDLNRHIDECLNRQLLPSSASSFPSASFSSAATTSVRQVKIDAFLVRRR